MSAEQTRLEQINLRYTSRILPVVWLLAVAVVAQEGQVGAPAARKTGSVKTINGNAIVLKLDSGEEVKVTVEDGARILRVNPGQTDLQSAATIALSDIAAGDRMLVRGKPGDRADSLSASTVVVMKQADVAQKQQKEREDWQRRGAGGIVGSVDAATGLITLTVTPTFTIAVKTGKETGFLRYAPNSVKFADAQKGTFDQIKPGDQLRVRGSRSADGKEIVAEEVISGTFRNIAGTISSIDTANNTMTVKDVLAKKTVVVKFNGDSQLRRLPPQIAQRIAFFLKSPEAAQQGASAAAAGGNRDAGSVPAGGAGAFSGPNVARGGRPGGGADFWQILGRLPAVKLADLQKDEAVMIVSTPGTGGSEVTAITLLSGVEPILTSNASGGAALLSGWNLSAPADAQ